MVLPPYRPSRTSISRLPSLYSILQVIPRRLQACAALNCSSYISAHPAQCELTTTEMVETALYDCQLNSSRRILAEIQLRINGFNTYG